jgi:surface protein
MANEIYPVSWWGSPVENGWGGIYYDFAQGGGLDGTSFITTWRTTTSNETITIPTSGGGYNYDISTSDGQTFNGVTGSQAITFASAGDYDVSISGDFHRIYFNNTGDKAKIIDIKQWGNIAWTSLNNAFRGCSNLVGTYTDAPDLSGVITLNSAFRDCSVFTGKVSNWDVSNVNTMGSMFRSASLFNGDCSSWDTSNVTEMNSMFQVARAFNQDISNWDVSNVTDMVLMLNNTNDFDQNLGSWDISIVTDFRFFATSATFSTSNYDAILIGWEATLQAAFPNGSGYTPSISINFGNSEYTGGGAAEASRTSLINNFNWTITDGGIA